MARVVWVKEATDQLGLIAAYIRIFDPDAADRLTARLFACADSLSDFPHRGRSVANGLREMVTVPPYILTYEVEGDIVFILGVRHGRQNVQA